MIDDITDPLNYERFFKHAYRPRDVGRTVEQELQKQQPPEFKVGDAVTQECGCVGYVTALGGRTVTWQVVRQGMCYITLGPSIDYESFLKHYLKPGDKVRCLPWPECTVSDKAGEEWRYTGMMPNSDKAGLEFVDGSIGIWPLACLERSSP